MDDTLFDVVILADGELYCLRDGDHSRFMAQDELDALHALLGEHCSVCQEIDED